MSITKLTGNWITKFGLRPGKFRFRNFRSDEYLNEDDEPVDVV